MKIFIKNVFANIVAILILGMVFFGLFALMMIASAASDKQIPDIRNNSVLALNFKTNILEAYTESEESLFDFGKEKDLLLIDVLEAIKKAKTDDKIKGISIEVDDFSAGITQVDDIRAALEDFKKTGKFVYAYGNIHQKKLPSR